MLDKTMGRNSGKQVVLPIILTLLVLLIAGTVLVYRGDVVILIPRLQNLDNDTVSVFNSALLSEGEEKIYLVRLYFISADKVSYFQEERAIQGGHTANERALMVLSELILGPTPRVDVYALPPTLEVREVYLDEGGVAYVDFGVELTRKRWGDTDWAIAVLHSIVKTLSANFPEIRRIQILVEGEDLENFLDVDTSRPLSERDFVAGQVGRVEEAVTTLDGT